METKIETTDERLKDLLCGAFEGGSGYWIDEVKVPSKKAQKRAGAEYYHESPVVGLELVITSEEGKHTLNRASLEKGLQVFAQKCPRQFGDFIAENDDAETSDCFLQCCLFGEVIFG